MNSQPEHQTCSDSLQHVRSSRHGCEDITNLPNLSLLKLTGCPEKRKKSNHHQKPPKHYWLPAL